MEDLTLTNTAPDHAAARARSALWLSRWINEPSPDLRLVLSGHDVARLTRRPRWFLYSLLLLGRFPRQRVYHGRAIGWHREDVLEWLTRDLALRVNQPHLPRACATRRPRQSCLPLDYRGSRPAVSRHANCSKQRVTKTPA